MATFTLAELRLAPSSPHRYGPDPAMACAGAHRKRIAHLSGSGWWDAPVKSRLAHHRASTLAAAAPWLRRAWITDFAAAAGRQVNRGGLSVQEISRPHSAAPGRLMGCIWRRIQVARETRCRRGGAPQADRRDLRIAGRCMATKIVLITGEQLRNNWQWFSSSGFNAC